MTQEEEVFRKYAGISHDDAERQLRPRGVPLGVPLNAYAADETGREAEPDALHQPSPDATEKPVSDLPTRGEVDARLQAAEARTETQFEKLRGEIRELKGATLGKASFLFGLIGLFAALTAVLGYGGQWFGLGLQSHDVLAQAAKQGAEQALAERPSVSPPPVTADTGKPTR